jgi:hypothetical protein
MRRIVAANATFNEHLEAGIAFGCFSYRTMAINNLAKAVALQR